MLTVAMCINFLFLFIRSSLFSLLPPLFFFSSFFLSVSPLCAALSLLCPSVSSQQRLSALLSLSDRRQPNLWRWLFEDGVVLVGWWLWVCGLRLWWCGFVFWVVAMRFGGVGLGLSAWVWVCRRGCGFAGVGMVGLGGCHGIRWRGFGFAGVGCGGFGFASVGCGGFGLPAWVSWVLGGPAWVWVCWCGGEFRKKKNVI
jgi:hypothetical protein